MRLEFRHLRYFLVLAEELHYGRAAKRLAISQPPLSVNIQQLEAAVGARLFDRDSKGVRLTPAGQAFRASARELLARSEDACAQAREVEAGEVGRLRLGFVGSTLYQGLPAWLRGFQQQRPRVEVIAHEQNSQEQIEALLREELDVGLIHTDRVPPGLQTRKLYSEPFLCCLPAEHPAARRRQIALADLKDEPLILFSRKVSPDYHARIVEICRAAGFYPRIRHEGRHWLSVVSLVAQGFGVSIVPASLKKAGIEGAVFKPVKEAIPESEVFAAWRGDVESVLREEFLGAWKA